MLPTPGVGRGHIGGASSGHNTRDTDFSVTDFSVRYLRIVLVVLVDHFIIISDAIAVAIALALAGRRGPLEQHLSVTNGGLVAVRRRLPIDLDIVELVHRVLDRSRGRRRRRRCALERVDVEDVHGARPQLLLRDAVAPVGGIDRLGCEHAAEGRPRRVHVDRLVLRRLGEHVLGEVFSMPTDLIDLRDRFERLELRGAERLRVRADQLVRRLGLEAELGVGELGRLRALEVFSVSRCGERAELVLEVRDEDFGALDVRFGDGGAGARRGGARVALRLAFGAAGLVLVRVRSEVVERTAILALVRVCGA